MSSSDWTQFERLEQLEQFLSQPPPSKEFQRALAVKLTYQNYSYREIQTILNVSLGFITKWKQHFEAEGITGLKSHHRGRKSYLDESEKAEIRSWLKQKNYWQLGELQYHLAFSYGVSFRSKQSYYELLKEAGLSWKKSQKKILGEIQSVWQLNEEKSKP